MASKTPPLPIVKDDAANAANVELKAKNDLENREKKRYKDLLRMTNEEVLLLCEQLEAELYDLGRREAKELVRGKYMQVISGKKRKYKTKI